MRKLTVRLEEVVRSASAWDVPEGARQRLADLAMRADGMELLDEAELRHWKSHMLVEALLEFAVVR